MCAFIWRSDILLVVLLFFQLMFKPFIGKWKNALDGYFLLNLIVLFSGSLYFSSRAEIDSGDMRQQVLEKQAIFSTVFICLGYLGFIIMLVYHIFNRFPNLKDTFLKLNCCRKKSEMVKIAVAQKTETHEEMETRDESLAEHFTSLEYFSEFRDSIL